ncbi:GTS1 [[Candida] subhashii]|uniref:GTS1 n=1 Tax=[Candida] subhashii TaxID=561895 RepID=A0A8J5QN77_9ASCO|nr:GTS1 [[Candida] subhashii]KAG7664599.1 GTS1 [[Candida] subhashii]
MSLRKQQKNTEKQLIDIVNSRVNENKCGECGNSYPTWASYNLGILLCGRCASVHRKLLGPPNKDISKVKSLTLDTWTEQQMENLRRIGNKKAKKKWNPKRVPFPYDADDDVTVVEQYIRDKYINGKFRDDNIENADYDDRSSKYSEEEVNRRSRSNSAASRTVIPRLTYRKLTTFEYTQYPMQVSKIMGFGYNDKDAVLESLLLTNGNIDKALDILEQESKINPNKTERPPDLPRRPTVSSTASGAATPSAAGITPTGSSGASQQQQKANEWWNPHGAAAAPPASSTPQIYQYTDPLTGQVSYIDSNGQEYLDPNNPQHQQQLMQMTNPQLVAQQTAKQGILSLYNQPTQFMTNVAAPVSQVPQGQQTQQSLPQQQVPQQQVPQQQQQPQQQFGFNQASFQQTGFAPQIQGQFPQQGQPGSAQPGQFTGFAPTQQQQQQQQMYPYRQQGAGTGQQSYWGQ